MLLSRVAARLNLVSRVFGPLHHRTQSLCSRCLSRPFPRRSFNSAADNRQPPRLWTTLEPELEEVLVPRKLSVSPLESWLSLRYSLPPLLEAPDRPAEAVVLPPLAQPVLEDEESTGAPLSCKNVLEIRRRKMNRHKYKKLLKRTKFLRRRVKEGRRRRKQVRFEKDLTRVWKRAGLKKAPEGWTMPKIFTKHFQSKGD
ncbi:small ribosomal subunit protein mS38 [Denticeps clupeoides]|uniref:Small ribosomal subunit protein mS38 n=1 Tax=Denticeps clupeoides TaxID=299321 RepID=A0AAY4ECL5_9TELE|nr:aurora kinase A-interacting protein [Denticeps clupeoides]XP_028850083.1 aurora kinase A-interacting protein [Denticeps clupeoides]